MTFLEFREEVAEHIYETYGEKKFSIANVYLMYDVTDVYRINNVMKRGIEEGIFKRVEKGIYQFIPL